jgi:hypothetical protein
MPSAPKTTDPVSRETKLLQFGALLVTIIVGDVPEQIHSEAAFSKLCSACPVPASSGKSSKHSRGPLRRPSWRLERGNSCLASTRSGYAPLRLLAGRRN